MFPSTCLRDRELAFVGQSVPVTVQIENQGYGGQSVDVRLVKDGTTVDSQEVILPADDMAEIAFEIRQSETNLTQYQIQVESFPDEATAADNSSAFLLRVVDKPIRVLMLEGKPYWDTQIPRSESFVRSFD